MGFAQASIAKIVNSSSVSLWVILAAGLALLLLVILAGRQLAQTEKDPRTQQVLTGASILLAFQILLLTSCEIFQKSDLRLATVTHLVTGLTIVWVIWLFLEPKRPSLKMGVTLLSTFSLLCFATVTLLLLWIQPAQLSSKANLVATLWRIINLTLASAGFVLLIICRPCQWGVGVGVLAALAAGITIPMIPDYSQEPHLNYVLFAQALSLPWLLALVQRFPGTKTPLQNQTATDQEFDKATSVDTKPALIDLLLQINLETNRAEKLPAIVKALSLGIVADICYLVQSDTEQGTLTLLAGYDLIREVSLPASTFLVEDLPQITSAWSEGRSLRFSAPSCNLQDVETLTQLLRVPQVGRILAYPLQLSDTDQAGGILLLSPYTGKVWGPDTLHLLEEVKATLTQIIFGEDLLETLTENLDEKSTLILQLQQTQSVLTTALIEKETALTELHHDLRQLKARYQIEKFESVQQIEALRKTIRQQRPSKSDSAAPQTSQEPVQSLAQRKIQAQVEQLTAQIRHLTEERDALKIALTRAQAQIKHLQTQAGQTGPTQLSIDQQIITLDSVAANVQLKLVSILQQKNLRLTLVNPDGRQMIRTDPELLQVVVEGLLENAAHASPPAGTIELTQTLSMETGMLIAEITDHGKGLDVAEQKALFNARLDTLPGIGSVSAIRRAIQAIRVLNGKIWLRSEKNQFTTFRIQLPVRIID